MNETTTEEATIPAVGVIALRVFRAWNDPIEVRVEGYLYGPLAVHPDITEATTLAGEQRIGDAVAWTVSHVATSCNLACALPVEKAHELARRLHAVPALVQARTVEEWRELSQGNDGADLASCRSAVAIVQGWG